MPDQTHYNPDDEAEARAVTAELVEAETGNRMRERGDGRGGELVRYSHNPSGNPSVDEVKLAAADFIDLLDHWIPDGEHSERARCKNLAVTQIETAAMFAVKALTADAPPSRPSSTGSSRDPNLPPRNSTA